MVKTLEDLRKEQYSDHGATGSRYFDHIFKVKTPKSAAQLEALIAEYVRRSGGKATKVSVMGRQITDKIHTQHMGMKATVTNNAYIPSSTEKGTSDLIIGFEGRILYCEVKFSRSDRLSPEQIRFKESVEAGPGPYIIAKSLNHFTEQFNEFINIL